MVNQEFIRALLIEEDPGRAILARDLLDRASAGLVDLVHIHQIGPGLERLASERFDVVLFGLVASEHAGGERVDRLLVQAPAVPIIVLAVRSEAEMALPMIRYGAQDFWVSGRDIGDALLQAIRYALERKPRLDRLVHQANYDPLTGLPNRYLFEDRLNHAAGRAKRQSSPLAVMFLDVDGFKQVNDRLGHHSGDHVLRQIAERIKGAVRASDTVARIGGDEFAIVLESLARVEDAAGVAQKVQDALAGPFIEGNQSFDLTCSIGISFFLLNGTEARSLLDHADQAMYRAKQLGGGRYSQCVEDLGVPALARFKLVRALQAGLERQEFRVFFQPQIEIVSGAVWGVEALLRWQHPEHGLIGPESFIAVLEDSAFVSPLGELVLRRACAQLELWQKACLPVPRMTVNIAARQLIRPGLSAMVAGVLRETGLSPERLEFEIKEGALIQCPDATTATLRELKELGVSLALDDFGNGHSAISYLRRLPIDAIKLDRTLVEETARRGTERTIALALTELAHSLAIRVVAKGVETEAQLAFLRETRCDAVQGFLISPPLDDAAIAAWLGSASSAASIVARPTQRRPRPRSSRRSCAT